MIGRGVRALSESIVTPFGVRQYYTRMYYGTDNRMKKRILLSPYIGASQRHRDTTAHRDTLFLLATRNSDSHTRRVSDDVE